MKRRVIVDAALVVVGLVCAKALSLATNACGRHLDARWLAQHGEGPPVALSPACALSRLAREYGLELAWYVAAPVAAATAFASLLLLLWKPTGARRARRAVGWANVGALALVLVANMLVVGTDEPEWGLMALFPLLVGFGLSLAGSFSGTRHGGDEVPSRSSPLR